VVVVRSSYFGITGEVRKGSWLCENRSLGCRSCAPSSRFACPRVYQLPSEGGEGDEPR